MPDVGAEKNDSGYYYPNDRATLVYNENNGTNEPSTINTSDLNTSLGDANEEFMRQEELRKNEEASRQNALQKYQDAHIQAARENTELQMLNAALTAEPAATPDETDRNPQISQQVVRLFIGGQDKGDVPAQISYIPQYNFNFDMYTPEKSQLDLAVDQIRSGAATVSELLDVRKYMLPIAALTVMNSDVLTAGLLDKFKSTKAADKELINEGKDFVGTLKGKSVELPGVNTEVINYTKKNPVETAELRKVFDGTERKKFLQELSEDVERLKNAGLSDTDIARMKDGLTPKGWQVHHKVPLDAGGANAMDNLVLINNDPYHKVITNFQNASTKGLLPGETKILEWPIPEGNIYPPGP